MPAADLPETTRVVAGAPFFAHQIKLRVRYSETDQMGTFYNSRPLEWFECGRTELLRALGLTYAEIESRGAFLPLVEAHVEYLGRARYDDLLRIATRASFAGRVRLRLDADIVQADTGRTVVRGYTVHVFTDRAGKVIRPPPWFLGALPGATGGSVTPEGPGGGTAKDRSRCLSEPRSDERSHHR